MSQILTLLLTCAHHIDLKPILYNIYDTRMRQKPTFPTKTDTFPQLYPKKERETDKNTQNTHKNNKYWVNSTIYGYSMAFSAISSLFSLLSGNSRLESPNLEHILEICW